MRTSISRIAKKFVSSPLNYLLKHTKTPHPRQIIESWKTQRKLISFYANYIKENDLCFDVGANIGDFTEALLHLGARVVSVEPQRQCVQILASKFRTNKKVTIVNKALGDVEGQSEILICEKEPSISTMSKKWKMEGRFSHDHNWTMKQIVEVTTLDKLIKKNGCPKYCKIDVEGFEFLVLKGLSQPIQLISFEFTQEFLDDMKQCVDKLLSLGNTKFNCVNQNTMQFIFPRWVSREELYQKIVSSKNPISWGDIYARHF